MQDKFEDLRCYYLLTKPPPFRSPQESKITAEEREKEERERERREGPWLPPSLARARTPRRPDSSSPVLPWPSARSAPPPSPPPAARTTPRPRRSA
uniref:Uncharacterized protein n=1 Tax=Aegilops tauschii subsp. strangulata TaxID=200361 RepID=A0A453R4V6_AEGTS